MENKIPDYINDWITIIEKMVNQNTYKLAWGRSIVEYVSLLNIDDNQDNIEYSLYDAAELVLKYYWNQTFFFNLKQKSDNNNADIITLVNKLIELYKQKVSSAQPQWFATAKEELKDTKEYKNTIKKISRVLKDNPVKYFLNVPNEASKKVISLPIYKIDNENSKIIIKIENARLIKEYGVVLSKLLVFKWTQLLEKYNFVPQLSGKVTAISNEKIRRNSLVEYKKQLIKEFEDGRIKDFYTGEIISYNEATVDHVLPWSFMYSDDIWNLVLTKKEVNSSKSNIIPSEEIINRLKARNNTILNIVDEKYKKDIILANENNYLDKYYFECKVSQ